MNAFEMPNLRFSLPAGAAVARRRFVSVDATAMVFRLLQLHRL
jgi:hypothetical protein